MATVTLTLTGATVTHDIEPRETLADFIRERCGLTATAVRQPILKFSD